jgi:regulator of protease activity HflC (stomatin/prohibitin superfamily)
MIGLWLVIVMSAIRIVPEYRRLVVLRLGKYNDTRGPGLVFIIPIIDNPIVVDLRETKQEFPRQSAVTQDGINISADLTVTWRVADPMKSVVYTRSVAQASQDAAIATWRSVIHDFPAGKLQAEREQINSELCARLDQATAEWGVKVTAFDIREMVLPPSVQSAARLQMSLVGLRGKVGQSLMPDGTVLLELSAVADELLTTGEEVVVTEIENSRLRVARVTRP